MKHMWLACAVFALGCGSKKDDKAQGGGGESPATGKGTPAEFKAWIPADAQKLWDGAWQGRMTSLQSNKKTHTTMAGDPVAIEVKGTEATVWDGNAETKMKFSIHTPCEARFAEPITEGSMKGGTSYHDMKFVIENGALTVGSGDVGFRKGKAAVVCTEGMDGGVTILDEKGTCTTWSDSFGRWEKKTTTCTWGQKDGKDTLTIKGERGDDELVAEGDVLVDQQFRDFAKYTKRAKDYADAKAQTEAIIKENDPVEQAKAAGGEVGKTDTVISFIATYGSDAAAWKGKPFEITAAYLNQNTSTSNGKTTYNVMLVDGKDSSSKFAIACDLGETKPPEGLKQYDKVVAKGTVGEAFGKPELESCTVAKAP